MTKEAAEHKWERNLRRARDLPDRLKPYAAAHALAAYAGTLNPPPCYLLEGYADLLTVKAQEVLFGMVGMVAAVAGTPLPNLAKLHEFANPGFWEPDCEGRGEVIAIAAIQLAAQKLLADQEQFIDTLALIRDPIPF